MKRCCRCKEIKPLSEFGSLKQSKDGHRFDCKPCHRDEAKRSRRNHVEKWREYDRERGAHQTPEYQHEYRKRFPEKEKAKTAVNNAVRDGRLIKQPCEVCGAEYVHGHHNDYQKPLDVKWLCPIHHKQAHQ